MLVADIQYRLKGIDVFGIYQTGRNYVWFIEFKREEDNLSKYQEYPGRNTLPQYQRCWNNTPR